MDWVRGVLGMGEQSGGGGDKPPPPRRTQDDDRPVSQRGAELERALRVQIGGLKYELDETKEELQAAMRARDQKTARIKLLRKKALENEIRQKEGLLANVSTTKKGVVSAKANQEQGLLMREAADEIQYLNRQTEQLDLEGAVDDLKEGIAETLDTTDLLSEPIMGEGELAASMGFQEETVDEELERMMRQQAEEDALDTLGQALPVPGGRQRDPERSASGKRGNKSTGN